MAEKFKPFIASITEKTGIEAKGIERRRGTTSITSTEIEPGPSLSAYP